MQKHINNLNNLIKDKLGFYILCYLIVFINFIEFFALKTGYLGRISFILLSVLGMVVFCVDYFINRSKYEDRQLKIFLYVNIVFYLYVLANGIFYRNFTRVFYGGYQYIIYYFIFFTVLVMLSNKKIVGILNFILALNALLSYVLLYEFTTRRNILYTTDFGKMAFDGITVVRGKAFFGSFLNAGVVLAVSCFFAIYFIITAISKRNVKKSIVYLFFFVSYVIGILSTGSRGPFVTIFAGLMFAGVLYGVILSNNKKLAIKVILALFVLLLIMIPIILNINYTKIDNKMVSFLVHRVQSIFNWSSDQGNVERIQSWKFSFGLIKSNPIFGVGIASTGAKGVGTFGIGVTESGLLKKFAEMGIVGLILSYSIFILVIITAVKIIKDPNKNRNVKIFVLLAASAFFAIMVEDVIYQATEAEVVSFYLWFVVALIYKGNNLENIEG